MRIRWPLWWYRICAYMSRAQLHRLSQWNLSFSDHMFVFWQYQRILKLAELFLRQQAFELWRTWALDWLGMANVLASTWKHDPLSDHGSMQLLERNIWSKPDRDQLKSIQWWMVRPFEDSICSQTLWRRFHLDFQMFSLFCVEHDYMGPTWRHLFNPLHPISEFYLR